MRLNMPGFCTTAVVSLDLADFAVFTGSEDFVCHICQRLGTVDVGLTPVLPVTSARSTTKKKMT